MFGQLNSFLKGSWQEFQHVNWPSRQETIRLVLIVVGISLVLAAFLGTLDFIFLTILQKIIAY